jgi:hypothetical protein
MEQPRATGEWSSVDYSFDHFHQEHEPARSAWLDRIGRAVYVALTKLQADALITLDEELAAAVKGLAPVAPFEALRDAASGLGA